jgi:hypothetical protein
MAMRFGGVAGEPLYTIQVYPCEKCFLGKRYPANVQPLSVENLGEVKPETCTDCKGTCVLIRGRNEPMDTVIERKGSLTKLTSKKFKVAVAGIDASMLTLQFAKEIEKKINELF